LLKKVDPTVKKETCYIAAVVLLFTAIMHGIFLVLESWDMTVLWGSMLGVFGAVLNFFLMGLTVQSVLGMEEKEARTKIKLSQQLRSLMLLVICALGAALPCFNLIAVAVPQLFPRIGVMLRPVFGKHNDA